MRVLLTGGHGFIGTWLTRALELRSHTVVAPSVDLFDVPGLRDLLGSQPWDVVVHLAAVSHNADATEAPELAYRTNVGGTALLVELLAELAPSVHLVFPSTAHVYAAASADEDEIVIIEERAIAPINLYGSTKWSGEVLLRDAAARLGLPVTILRLFNHTHHTQGPRAFLPHLFHAMRGAAGQALDIPVGNLDVARDLGGLADLLGAFVAVIEGEPPPNHVTYNVCSGHSLRLREVAEGLADRLGVDARFVTDPSRVREGEPSRMLGSHERLTEATGWRPTVTDTASFLDAFLDENPIPGTPA